MHNKQKFYRKFYLNNCEMKGITYQLALVYLGPGRQNFFLLSSIFVTVLPPLLLIQPLKLLLLQLPITYSTIIAHYYFIYCNIKVAVFKRNFECCYILSTLLKNIVESYKWIALKDDPIKTNIWVNVFLQVEKRAKSFSI